MSDYNITAVTRRKVYSGSAGTGPYAFTFPVISQTDIAVYKNSTKLTLTTNYTVTISSANGTGSVTLVVAATGSDQITIVGSRTIQRTTDFVTAGDLSAASLNEQLDGEIIMIQQIAEENKRTLKAPVYDLEAAEDGGTLNMVLPTAALRAGNVLAFDSTGNPIATEEIGDYRGNWATSTLYAKRDLIKDTSNNNVYRANTQHTSTGSQPISSNADSAKWDLIVDAAAAGTSATAAAASASAASSSASAASSSASSATSSASSASTSASTATTQASNASTSATNAASSASSASTSATNASNSASSASSSAALAAAAVAGGLYSSVIDKSANYTVALADAGDLIRVTTTSGAVTITLPQISTVSDGFKVAIVKWTSDANAVNIVRSGSDTINGATSASVGSQYAQTTFVADFETNQWFASSSGLGSTNVVVDAFNGTGSQTAFTLSGDPGTENNTYVYVSGVYQAKATYSLSTTTLTFSTAPPSGTANIEVVWTQPLPVGTPSDGTVTTAKIVDANVTTAKIVDANVTAAKLATNAVTTAKILDANVTLAKLSATGTPSASNFLRGDNTWAVASSSPTVLTYNSSSTWTKATDVPAGCTMAMIENWGGGGGGPRTTSFGNNVGGGGGGAYDFIVIPISSLGATETVTVGAAGLGATTTAAGGVGGNSSFGSWITATGGAGGANAGGQSPFYMTSSTTGGGGTNIAGFYVGSYTTDGTTNYPNPQTFNGGGGGISSGGLAAQPSVYGGGGGGCNAATAAGTSRFGGNGGTASATPTAGTQPGGGGASATVINTNGSNGGAGRVKVTMW
jgi:hypothetical protein